MFQFGSYSFSDHTAKFHPVHIYPDEQVMHDARAGKTQRLAGEALETRAQREMFAFDLLHRPLSYRVLRGREMPSVDPRFVRVIPSDTKRLQQGAEFQEHRILPGTHHISQDSPCAMIDRMPQPPLGRFGPDETPPLIQLDGALWPAAADA